MPPVAQASPLPLTPQLRAVAKRVVWFQPPKATLEQPRQFLTYLMTYGTLDDVATVLEAVGKLPLVQVLDDPLPGIFDGRSWRFWHLFLKGQKAPPLPRRFADAPALAFPGK